MSKRSAVAILRRTAWTVPRVERHAFKNWTPLQPLNCRHSSLLHRCPAAAVTSNLRRRQDTEALRTYSQKSENKIYSFEDMQRMIADPKANIVIVDSREPSELQESGRIPGALNIPIKSAPDSFHLSEEEFEDRYGFARPDRDAEVIFYCRSGVRSKAAAGLARDAGWTKVAEYPGSWLDWSGKGGQLER